MFKSNNNHCKQIRLRFSQLIGSRFFSHPGWIHRHIAHCPKCQARLKGFSRVELALSLMKSLPQHLDLLKRANRQAVRILNHRLREQPKAEYLKQMQAEPAWLNRMTKYTHSIANAAACLAIMLLMRIGVFSSMDKIQEQGRHTLKQYYAQNLGDDTSLMDDLFET